MKVHFLVYELREKLEYDHEFGGKEDEKCLSKS